ncbi:MAG: hypothetical protein PGN21_15305 [Sphingomonas paucimobilis]
MFAVVAAMLLTRAAPPARPSDEEIVVTGERPRNFRIVMKRDRRAGVKRCTLKPSSGDPLFDGGVCQAYLACVPTVRTAKEMEACMTPPLGEAVKAWQERRKAATPPR